MGALNYNIDYPGEEHLIRIRSKTTCTQISKELQVHVYFSFDPFLCDCFKPQFHYNLAVGDRALMVVVHWAGASF